MAPAGGGLEIIAGIKGNSLEPEAYIVTICTKIIEKPAERAVDEQNAPG